MKLLRNPFLHCALLRSSFSLLFNIGYGHVYSAAQTNSYISPLHFKFSIIYQECHFLHVNADHTENRSCHLLEFDSVLVIRHPMIHSQD